MRVEEFVGRGKQESELEDVMERSRCICLAYIHHSCWVFKRENVAMPCDGWLESGKKVDVENYICVAAKTFSCSTAAALGYFVWVAKKNEREIDIVREMYRGIKVKVHVLPGCRTNFSL